MSKQFKTNKKKIEKLESKILKLLSGVTSSRPGVLKILETVKANPTLTCVEEQKVRMAELNSAAHAARIEHDRYMTMLNDNKVEEQKPVRTFDDPKFELPDEYKLSA